MKKLWIDFSGELSLLALQVNGYGQFWSLSISLSLFSILHKQTHYSFKHAHAFTHTHTHTYARFSFTTTTHTSSFIGILTFCCFFLANYTFGVLSVSVLLVIIWPFVELSSSSSFSLFQTQASSFNASPFPSSFLLLSFFLLPNSLFYSLLHNLSVFWLKSFAIV